MKTLDRCAAVLAAAVALASLAACDRAREGAPAATPDASAQTIDVKPAPPTGDTPGTTPVTGKQSNLSEGQKQTQMPLEGQDHNYSSVAPVQSQKAGSGYAPSEGRNAKPDAREPGEQQPTQQGRSQK